MNKTPTLTLVSEPEEEAPTASMNWIILKRKTDPKSRTEVVIKLNKKDRHPFMTKPGEPEEEITAMFNVHDKRVFENVFAKIRTGEI